MASLSFLNGYTSAPIVRYNRPTIIDHSSTNVLIHLVESNVALYEGVRQYYRSEYKNSFTETVKRNTINPEELRRSLEILSRTSDTLREYMQKYQHSGSSSSSSSNGSREEKEGKKKKEETRSKRKRDSLSSSSSPPPGNSIKRIHRRQRPAIIDRGSPFQLIEMIQTHHSLLEEIKRYYNTTFKHTFRPKHTTREELVEALEHAADLSPVFRTHMVEYGTVSDRRHPGGGSGGGGGNNNQEEKEEEEKKSKPGSTLSVEDLIITPNAKVIIKWLTTHYHVADTADLCQANATLWNQLHTVHHMSLGQVYELRRKLHLPLDESDKTFLKERDAETRFQNEKAAWEPYLEVGSTVNLLVNLLPRLSETPVEPLKPRTADERKRFADAQANVGGDNVTLLRWTGTVLLYDTTKGAVFVNVHEHHVPFLVEPRDRTIQLHFGSRTSMLNYEERLYYWSLKPRAPNDGVVVVAEDWNPHKLCGTPFIQVSILRPLDMRPKLIQQLAVAGMQVDVTFKKQLYHPRDAVSCTRLLGRVLRTGSVKDHRGFDCVLVRLPDRDLHFRIPALEQEKHTVANEWYLPPLVHSNDAGYSLSLVPTREAQLEFLSIAFMEHRLGTVPGLLSIVEDFL